MSRAYRWGEDGLGGISDRFGFLNFAVALWNGKDPILKERLFGLTNEEGNHGEDAKEYWWALDGTPTHSWMQWLYRYPQAEFPYEQLRRENRERTRDEREFELGDTGILDDHEFFDVMMTYAKAGPDDMCIRITATNHGPRRRRCTCCRRSGCATRGRGASTTASPSCTRSAATAGRPAATAPRR